MCLCSSRHNVSVAAASDSNGQVSQGVSRCLCVCVCVCVVQDIVFQLQRLVTAMAKYHNECHAVLKDAEVFPIEVDLSRSMFTYDTVDRFNDGSADDDDVDVVEAAEADSDTHDTQNTDDVNLISTD